ncbi:MAG TPA: Lpg1974 family pore-forming outer membrane protein [Planctomycetaceae bacterium]|nr:Lpg1974 family pore-forming outer membrane protein [Planctomycetaceae bacterium]
MKRIRIWMKSIVAAAAVCGASPLLAAGPPAQLVSMQDVDTRFAAMQAELAALRSRLDDGGAAVVPAPAHGAYPMAAGCGTCSSDCCEESGGCVFGFELVIVKPHFDHGVDIQALSAADGGPDFRQTENDWDYHASPRFWIGYVNAEGLGARFRYWQYDHEAETLTFPTDDPTDELQTRDASLELHVIDIEAMQSVNWCQIDANFSGGLRYASVDLRRRRVDAENGLTTIDYRLSHNDFEGVGLTGALELRRPIGCSGLALVGAGRGSLLYGETKLFAYNDDNGNAVRQAMVEDDDVVYVLEGQLGVEFGRDMNNGMRVALRAMAEGQLWGGAVFDGNLFAGGFPTPGPFNTERNTADNNLGFFGATIGVTVER